MNAHKSALEAVEMMQHYDVSAVAVVDKSNSLIGSFSMAAFRSIMLEQLGALALPVAEFLNWANGREEMPGAPLASSGISVAQMVQQPAQRALRAACVALNGQSLSCGHPSQERHVGPEGHCLIAEHARQAGRES
jgi:hypothetical protein